VMFVYLVCGGVFDYVYDGGDVIIVFLVGYGREFWFSVYFYVREVFFH
jgi:hypothetical protein